MLNKHRQPIALDRFRCVEGSAPAACAHALIRSLSLPSNLDLDQTGDSE